MTKLIEVLCLGAGVQSSYLLLKSIHDELPKLDYAIFADTKAEPKAVYQWLDLLKEQCANAGITLAVVSEGDLKADIINNQIPGSESRNGRWASIPMFTTDQLTGSKGMVRRQCTAEYKIKPIERFMRQTILGLKPRQRAPLEPQIRQWFGISWDERRRMKVFEDKWRHVWYPLVESRTTRLACITWLKDHGYHPPRSACIFCPFHSDRAWRNLKMNSPDEWQEAVDFDYAIRRCGGMRGETFLHASRKPLDEVDLQNDYDRGQLPLWENECEGMCGL